MIPWESCVLWLGYPLQNGVWPDISKYDNDGIITGAFWEGDSLEFDGTDDYVNVGNDPSLDVTQAITIELWLYRNVVAGDYERVLSKDDSTPIEGFLFGLQISDTGLLQFLFETGDVLKYTASSNTIPVKQWVHVAGVYDRVYIKTYIDGVLDGTPTAQSGVMDTSTGNLNIGRLRNNGGAYLYAFDGLINLVRIYNIALSAEQIKESYEQTYRLI